MFMLPPVGFHKLREVTESLGQVTLIAPIDIEDIGLRLRHVYAQARAQGYADLRRTTLRRLPYALWLDGQPSLPELEPELVQAYWARHLPEALRGPRTAKRWLGPLFYAYVHHFGRPGLRAFGHRILMALEIAQGPFAELLRKYQTEFRFFVPEEVGLHLGAALAKSREPMAQTLESLQLWPGFLEERIAEESFRGALRLPVTDTQNDATIRRILEWSRNSLPGERLQSITRYPQHRILLADTLVQPWYQGHPPESLRSQLLTHFVKHYGDPRHLDIVHHGHHWQGVAEPTVQTVKRWMVGDTLRGFMRLLQLTADDIWRYRERFWMAYYDKGLIEEAWLALGNDAARAAKRESRADDWAQYGTLGSAMPNQSVLFLRIGHVVFMEWSHSGSLRACLADDPSAPPLYQPEYNANELRRARSLDFHNGMNEQPQLRHAGSSSGSWQRKARDFITNHTGAALHDRDILE
jgi:EH_Signature domain